jgi:hypothetical protein
MQLLDHRVEQERERRSHQRRHFRTPLGGNWLNAYHHNFLWGFA